jgi:DNA repair protein SbcC/Rad50
MAAICCPGACLIPLRLSVKNFLCYREDVPVLDFAGLHVACLCGSNGHGKSALLDAVTWCLWGKARGRSQDDLISYGADQSRVELEFLNREAQYRVIRSHMRAGGRRRQGATDLQFQLVAEGAALPIGGNTVRETQAKIEHLIGMDYDTFINSAFLLQGRADEFTNKTPSERKAVLASILGLDVYDRLQVRSRECLREAESDARVTQGSLDQMRRDIEAIGDPTEELTGVARYLADLEVSGAEQARLASDLQRQVSALEQAQTDLAVLEKGIQDCRQEIQQLESRAATHQNRIQQFQEVIGEAPAIEDGVRRLQDARRRFEALEQARSQFDALNRQRSDLLHAMEAQRVRLEGQLEQLERRAQQELYPKAEAEAGLAQERQQVQQQLGRLAEQQQEILDRRSYYQALATRIGETQSTAERYRLEGTELRSKLDLLNASDRQDAACPLCGTSLGGDGCTRLAETYQGEIEDKRRQYRDSQAQLKQLEAEKTSLEAELPRKEQALSRGQRDAELKLQDLDRRIQESCQARQELEDLRPQLETLQASLASGDFVVQQQAQAEDLERQIARLEYNEEARQESYAQMRELQQFEERQSRLAQATARLPEEEESLTQARGMLQRRRDELAHQEETLQSSRATLNQLPQRQEQLREARRALAELEAGRQSAIGRRGYLEGEVRRLEQLRRQVDAGASRLAELEEEQSIYQELASAFGRQGVQAMLIETVVPRLEEEANRLLGRMTDNRMHVKLETQRERSTGRGEPRETLDINVSDELGPRSYEMYSGGEAFRVNLALRIALSRVLAQRMGAPLPTLFIDEGFGTQDAAGRERILDVISAIQEDFDKIIVITHLDDLKDMFPVRIEVHKDGNGSTFWIS